MLLSRLEDEGAEGGLDVAQEVQCCPRAGDAIVGCQRVRSSTERTNKALDVRDFPGASLVVFSRPSEL